MDCKKFLIIIVSILIAIFLVFVTIGHYYDNKEQLILGTIEANAYTIKSPASGIVKDIYVKNGDIVKKNTVLFTITSKNHQYKVVSPKNGEIFDFILVKNNAVAKNGEYLNIYDYDKKWISFTIKPDLAKNIHIGDKIDMELAEYNGEPFEMTIMQISMSTDNDNQAKESTYLPTVKVIAFINNDNEELRVGRRVVTNLKKLKCIY